MKTRLYLGLLIVLLLAAGALDAQLNCSGGACGFASGTFTGTTTFTGTGRFADGTVGTPSISFTAETGLGFYRSATTELDLAITGQRRHVWVPGGYAIKDDAATVYLGASSDTLVARTALGVVAIGTGGGAAAGTLKVKITQLTSGAFSTLAACAAGTEGQLAAVTDSSTTTYGATVTGGGAGHIPAYCNGTAWTVH